ncbi:MAG: hypothetical protein HQK83_08715 [Fibrobacteria bacterium]|nr:hypothetical protein [Fibrobacteria bacterium]
MHQEKKIFYRYFCGECSDVVHTDTPVIDCPNCGEETNIFYQGMYVNGRWVSWDEYRDQGVLMLMHSLVKPSSKPKHSASIKYSRIKQY